MPPKQPIAKSNYLFARNLILIMILGLSFLAFEMIADSYKKINDLTKSTGQLIFKEIRKEKFKGNNERSTFVFKINGLDQSLGIFLGSGKSANEEGDNWNRKFQLGDELTVYYDNNFIGKFENITRNIYRIDKNGQKVFERGFKQPRFSGLLFVGLSILLLGLLIWLNRTYEKSKASYFPQI